MTDFFSWVTAPYMTILGDFALPLVWGFVISLLYIKTENSSLTMIVGILLLTGLIESNSYLSSSTYQLYLWAAVIGAVGVGSSLFYLFKIRAQTPA